MAVSVCPSHKLMDASSIYTFVQTWAAIATRDNHEYFSQSVKLPEFVRASPLSPNISLLGMAPSSTSISRPINGLTGVTRRLIFTLPKVAELKARCSIFLEIGEKRPTSVEVVQALMLKCAIHAASTCSSLRRALAVFQTVNLRKWMDPPLPDNAIGNLSWKQLVSLADSSNIELCEAVIKIRKGLDEFHGRERIFKGSEGGAMIAECLREKQEMDALMKDSEFRADASVPIYDQMIFVQKFL